MQVPCEALQGLRPKVPWGVSPEESPNLRNDFGYIKSESTICSVFPLRNTGWTFATCHKEKDIEGDVTEGKQVSSG